MLEMYKLRRHPTSDKLTNKHLPMYLHVIYYNVMYYFSQNVLVYLLQSDWLRYSLSIRQ